MYNIKDGEWYFFLALPVLLIAAAAFGFFTWGKSKGISEGRAEVVRECPPAQGEQILLQSMQYQDGRVFCQYADTGGWSVKKWKENR